MRIKAFTIWELLVSMIISSILISLSWYLVSMTNTYRARVEHKGEGLAELKRVEFLLNKDLFRAGRYQLTTQQLDLWLPDDSVQYLIGESSFCRLYHGHLDTVAKRVQVSLFEQADEDILASISFDGQLYDFEIPWTASSTRKVRLKQDETTGSLSEATEE